MKIITLFHLEGSFTNPEGDDASQINNLIEPGATTLSGATIPTYPNEQGRTGNAWNVMAGLTIGFNYVIAVD